jgi:hypothetical protein
LVIGTLVLFTCRQQSLRVGANAHAGALAAVMYAVVWWTLKGSCLAVDMLQVSRW